MTESLRRQGLRPPLHGLVYQQLLNGGQLLFLKVGDLRVVKERVLDLLAGSDIRLRVLHQVGVSHLVVGGYSRHPRDANHFRLVLASLLLSDDHLLERLSWLKFLVGVSKVVEFLLQQVEAILQGVTGAIAIRVALP